MSYQRVIPTGNNEPGYCIANNCKWYDYWQDVRGRRALKARPLKLDFRCPYTGKDRTIEFLKAIGEPVDADDYDYELSQDIKQALANAFIQENGWKIVGIRIYPGHCEDEASMCIDFELINEVFYCQRRDIDKSKGETCSYDELEEKLRQIPPAHVFYSVNIRKLQVAGVGQILITDYSGEQICNYQFDVRGTRILIKEFVPGSTKLIERRIMLDVDKKDRFQMIADIEEYR